MMPREGMGWAPTRHSQHLAMRNSSFCTAPLAQEAGAVEFNFSGTSVYDLVGSHLPRKCCSVCRCVLGLRTSCRSRTWRRDASYY
mmetsp:Transcript_9278/g.23100  ORF Transcript_9278/g.23100 Transcript_9278/m.23100 type:complete len:85 (-) Transcript_9278:87-341(-)